MSYKWHDDDGSWHHTTDWNTPEHLASGSPFLKSYGKSTYFYDDKNKGKSGSTPTDLQIKHNALHLTGLEYKKPDQQRNAAAHQRMEFNDLDTDQFVVAYGREMRNSGDGDITNKFLNNFMNEKKFRTGKGKNKTMKAFWKGDASDHLQGIYSANKSKGPKYDEKTGKKLKPKAFEQSFANWDRGETTRSMDIRRAVGEHLNLDRKKIGELSYHSQVSDFMRSANDNFSNNQAQPKKNKKKGNSNQSNQPYVMPDAIAKEYAYQNAYEEHGSVLNNTKALETMEAHKAKYTKPGKDPLNTLLGMEDNDFRWDTKKIA